MDITTAHQSPNRPSHLSKEILIALKLGIHMRVCGLLVRLTTYVLGEGRDPAVSIYCNQYTGNARSITDYMFLAAGPGSRITVTVAASDEKARCYLEYVNNILTNQNFEAELNDRSKTSNLKLPDDVVQLLRKKSK